MRYLDRVAVKTDWIEMARGLAAGNALEEIAADGGVAMSTVRSQLRQVLEKTGCSRQAEVVSLLASHAGSESGNELAARALNRFLHLFQPPSSVWGMRPGPAGFTIGSASRTATAVCENPDFMTYG
ncbi:hypothetical protein LJR220_002406 [Bradyrhizobium sp. LjRoot220]|uniref:helix-turn-helix transcriptional regulator n=1 Tax=Bradyrhizobium sp. LjRoot220 TaxID=3342284 RepID=UPI003ECEEA7F